MTVHSAHSPCDVCLTEGPPVVTEHGPSHHPPGIEGAVSLPLGHAPHPRPALHKARLSSLTQQRGQPRVLHHRPDGEVAAITLTHHADLPRVDEGEVPEMPEYFDFYSLFIACL